MNVREILDNLRPSNIYYDYIKKPYQQCKKDVLKLAEDTGKAFSNFLFRWSKEPAFIMLFFNALAAYSSHTAQIHGLEKSHRENKDYLIEQEKKERKIDLALTVVPPFILHKYLLSRLDKGHFTTRSARYKMLRCLPSSIGQGVDAIYRPSYMTFKENALITASKIVNILFKYSKNLPNCMRNIPYNLMKADYNLKRQLPDHMFDWSLEHITTFFDDKARDNIIQPGNANYKMMRNGSAYDEFFGQASGYRVLASLLYLVIASSIIMPYLKNKWTKAEHEKKLKLKNETNESIRRKDRWEYTWKEKDEKDGTAFEIFSKEYEMRMKAKEIPDISKSNIINSHIALYKTQGLKI